MKFSSLLTESHLLYKSIEQQLEKGSFETDQGKWIERAFGLAMKSWLDIEEMARNNRFSNREEEIYFYKNLKPAFIGLIEYFTLLYKSVVFQPEDSAKRGEYWKHELKKCRELVFTYSSGCQYYEQQQSNTDIYFLEQSNQQPLLFGLNASRINFADTSYSYLRSRLIAMKRYEKYIQCKLSESVSSLENQLNFKRYPSVN
jgi:hypothetical protein